MPDRMALQMAQQWADAKADKKAGLLVVSMAAQMADLRAAPKVVAGLRYLVVMKFLRSSMKRFLEPTGPPKNLYTLNVAVYRQSLIATKNRHLAPRSVDRRSPVPRGRRLPVDKNSNSSQRAKLPRRLRTRYYYTYPASS